MLELRDGRLVHSLTIWGAVLRDYPALVRYQLVQHEPALFELKLVTRDARAFDEIAASAVPRLRDLLGGVEIEATPHDVLEADDCAKFQALVPLRG